MSIRIKKDHDPDLVFGPTCKNNSMNPDKDPFADPDPEHSRKSNSFHSLLPICE
jgi:hypothetical protein